MVGVFVCITLTVSFNCPSSSALRPNKVSAVSWKQVTHWLSLKSAKFTLGIKNKNKGIIHSKYSTTFTPHLLKVSGCS